MRISFVIHSSDDDALDALRRSAAQLREKGHDVEARITFEAGDSGRFARQAADGSVDLVLAAGGDGTLNEVANGLLSAGSERKDLPKLGIVPLGTANDLAGWLGIPTDIEEAVATAVASAGFTADVLAVNDRHFLNVSSGGLGAEATEDAPPRAKRALGALAYVVTGVRKFAALTPSAARFTSGSDLVFEGDFLLFAVGNGRRTGGGNWITPRASITDGLLDVCIVPEMTHADFIRVLPDLRAGRHLEHERVVYRQVADLLVEPEGEVSVNADGEPLDARRFAYRVLPRALTLAAAAPDDA